MSLTLIRRCMATACVAVVCGLPLGHAAQPKPISRLERAADAIEIQNIMGRYSIYVVANEWIEIGKLFALDEPDVRQNVPREMSGPDVRAYFEKRNDDVLPPGVMHQHSFLAPLIEVAGDGKTAKGVWDSVGVDTGNGDNMANWGWVRYAIDFKKLGGEWKIWHMRVSPVWRAPYGEAWSQMVQQASKGAKRGGGAPGAVVGASAPGAAPTPPPGPPPGAGAPAQGPEQRWRYSGTDDTPVIPANPPKPYYTFDPADAY
jgi:hypothetical protein